MLTTGAIRRVDDLGRIVIPKDIRRRMQIEEETPMEFFIEGDAIVLKKYRSEQEKDEIAIVEKWATGHSRKTILQDFLEKYPKASMAYGIHPVICPHHLGYEEAVCEEIFRTKCKACWDRPLEEVQKNDSTE